MEFQQRILSDHFNPNSYLKVNGYVGDQMSIQSVRGLDIFPSGTSVQVYSSREPANDVSDRLYQYLLAMSEHYGSRETPTLVHKFDFAAAPKALNLAKELRLQEAGTPFHVRIVTDPYFFGFQTYSKVRRGQKDDIKRDPVIWFDKGLPKANKEAHFLSRALSKNGVRDFSWDLAT